MILGGIVFALLIVVTSWCWIINYNEKRSVESRENINRKLSKEATFYEKYLKRLFDIIIAFIGLIITSPFVIIACILIYIEDPGNVIFKQKRVGLNKSHFYIHKLRSMKRDTGDIPTHLLCKEEQQKRILKIGRFIRRTSIDEFGQMIDILRHRMSAVGPRPALWNQFDLIEEREKYNANSVLPGLTGLAQINGRDELEIPVKAKLDGEYVTALRKSSWDGFVMDCRCFFGTFTSVLCSKGVVEGGTGVCVNRAGRSYAEGKDNESLIGEIGFGEAVEVDKGEKKKVLITGSNSYIGTALSCYAKKYYPSSLEICEVDVRDNEWKGMDFSDFDAIYHVAGIAHADIEQVSEEEKEKYYVVNTDLAVAVAKKAKAEGVKRFVFMSSMIVYGDSANCGKKRVIDENTVPVPTNFYGDSKLQADVAVRDLATESFKVIVLRSPMIYGPKSKGNYLTLANLVEKLRIFPEVENERSMLFIGNLCELLCQIMLSKNVRRNAIVLLPQNAEWVKTSDLVRKIATVRERKVFVTRFMQPVVVLAGKLPGKVGKLVNKAFGNNCYSVELSKVEGIKYWLYTFEESVMLTESVDKKK